MLMAALMLAGCSEAGPQSKPAAARPAPAVTVSKPIRKVVTDFDEYVGRFTAVDYVEVRARVSGYLEKIHFRDGQLVKANDALFTIDRRPFEAAMEQVKAARVQADANLAFAENDLNRGKNLVRDATISKKTLDQRLQAKNVAKASVTAAVAAVRQAELDLQYTELKAPISGRIGDRRVSIGNLVTGGTGGNTTLLATIVSIDPIRFEFTVDEASYLRLLASKSAVRPDANDQNRALPVSLKLIDEDDFIHTGHLEFIDNVIDPSSGTIRLRAQFPNPDGKLTPGMFGRIKVQSSLPASALMVPDTAIGTEQVRKFVYTVDDKNIVNPKYVTLGPVVEGMRVITAGLAADDLVVVNGLMRIRPGAKVSPQQSTADASLPKNKTVQTN